MIISCPLCDQQLVGKKSIMIWYKYPDYSTDFKCSCSYRASYLECSIKECDFRITINGSRFGANIYYKNGLISDYEFHSQDLNIGIFTGNFLTIEKMNEIFDYKNLSPIIEKIKMMLVFK